MLITKKNLLTLVENFLREEEDKNIVSDELRYWHKTHDEIDYKFDWKIMGSKKITPGSESDMVVGKCDQTHCAQWVSDTFGKDIRIGNAWHADRLISPIGSPIVSYASHRDSNFITEAFIKRLNWCFDRINAKPKKTTMLDETKEIAKYLVPDQKKFMNLKLGDIVGLFYEDSENVSRAFFEAATGYTNMGKGSMETPGGYFVTKAEGTPWSSDMLGKDILFKPSDSFIKSKKGFPCNTHIGVVGAIHKGVPIIYHNIHKSVHAVGLNGIDNSNVKIFWAASRE